MKESQVGGGSNITLNHSSAPTLKKSWQKLELCHVPSLMKSWPTLELGQVAVGWDTALTRITTRKSYRNTLGANIRQKYQKWN